METLYGSHGWATAPGTLKGQARYIQEEQDMCMSMVQFRGSISKEWGAVSISANVKHAQRTRSQRINRKAQSWCEGRKENKATLSEVELCRGYSWTTQTEIRCQSQVRWICPSFFLFFHAKGMSHTYFPGNLHFIQLPAKEQNIPEGQFSSYDNRVEDVFVRVRE